jgi:outer membrane protein TolC
MDLSLSDADGAEWNYLVNPAASLYLRQPLFIDRINESPLRFDSLQLAEELASIGVERAKLSRTALENNLIILLTRTAAVLNSLNNSTRILESRISLADKRLSLALEDEEAGKLSSLDRLSEELQRRRLQETMIDLIYQRDSAARELEQLIGEDLTSESYVRMTSLNNTPSFRINPQDSLNVLNSEAAARSIELAGTVVQNGSEPVFEVSALYRRSDSEAATDIGSAFDDAGSAEMNLSLSMAVSFPLLDWGEMSNAHEAERQNLLAAEERLRSARENAELTTLAVLNNLNLIEEKTVLLLKGLEYDQTLLERENVRFEAGLSSEAAVETIKLDLLEREYSINQLRDEKMLTIMELYNTGGLTLKTYFTLD